MPYYRKRRNRRYRRRAKPWYQRKYNAAQLAHKAYRGVRYLKGLVNSETFTHDTVMNVAPSTAGSVYTLNDIAQGDGPEARTGNSILMKWLSIRMKLTRNSAATDTSVRCIIFVDKQQVGDVAPAAFDLLDVTYSGIIAMMNKNNAGRFSKLYDSTFNVNSVKTNEIVKTINLPLGKNGLHARYNGALSTDFQRNGLYCLFVSDEATNTPSLDAVARVGYHDN